MPVSDKNPFGFDEVSKFIWNKLDGEPYISRVSIIQVPNISTVVYGRDVGYKIEKVELDEQIERISATKIREEIKKKENNK
jgi:hypothetical protein